MPYDYIKNKTDPILRKFIPNLNSKPMYLTLGSILFKLITIYLLFNGLLYWAFVTLVLEIILDILDGYYARINKKTSKLGGFLDHSADFIIRPFYILAILFLAIINPYIATIFILTYLSSILIDFISANYKLKKISLLSAGPSIVLLIGIPFNILPIIILLATIFNIIMIIIKFSTITIKNKIK